MARPNKPTTLKVLQGTQRSGRVNSREPKVAPLTTRTRPPSWLSPSAKAAWRRMLPLVVDRMKVATAVDVESFTQLCDAWGEYQDTREYVIENGSTYEAGSEERGYTVQMRPEVRIAQDAWRRVKLMLTEFGMTPASRAKVATVDAGLTDPLEQWAQGDG